jgi:hypothetical protein
MHAKLFSLVILAGSLVASPALHAQIVWSVDGPQTITGTTDIFTGGSFVDALQTHRSDPTAGTAVSPETVTNSATHVPVTFGVYNTNTLRDSYFSFGGNGDGGAGRPTTPSSTYNDVLDGCTFVQPGPDSFSISGLQTGHTYELQVWDSTGYATTFTDGNAVTLNGDQFDTGTFVYSGNAEVVSYAAAPGSGYGTVDAVSIREITSTPEPSTYAMLFAGIGALLLVSRLRRVA